MGGRYYIKPGEVAYVILPHSEVCMHMRVAGKRAYVYLTIGQYPSAQIRRKDGHSFSAPVLPSEAGIMHDEHGYYYYAPHKSDPAVWLE